MASFNAQTVGCCACVHNAQDGLALMNICRISEGQY